MISKEISPKILINSPEAECLVPNEFEGEMMHICTMLHNRIRHRTYQTEISMKIKSLRYLRRKSNDRVCIYTDASQSRVSNSSAFGIFCPVKKYSEGVKLKNPATVFSTEVHAILYALKYARKMKIKKPLILTDSLTVCIVLNKQRNCSFTFEMFHKIMKLMIKVDAAIAWIPSHVGIFGNERADHEAKKALGIEIF
jgi:ribonuclease HI